ncbi:hypothetical protein [Flavobacterium sp.]|uniref:hypothetical protein n=1 Tax=Flavobacterium sp. TaxID=239 RepID=UPI003750D770
MKKILLVIVLIFNSLSIIGQVDNSNDAISKRLMEEAINGDTENIDIKLEKLLDSIKNQNEQKDNIINAYSKGGKYDKASEPEEEEAWGGAYKKELNKPNINRYTSISQDDLYETLPDGTRRAKYPYVPSWATTIEQVEQYFKEHPSEMNNFKDKENQSVSSNENESYSNNESYSENRFENTLSNPIGIIAFAIIICFLIAEFFGRRKHIGRWWSFFLLLCGLIPGIVAIMVSPSAKNNPTQGGKNYSIWGWILIVFGVLNLVIFAGSSGKAGMLFYIFFVISYYLFELSKGKIKNLEPKFYY